MPTSPGEFSFDEQASDFDQRAGFPPETVDQIARCLIDVSRCGEGDVFADMGAGTGTLGASLNEALTHYVGLDLSEPMLGAFHAKDPKVRLVRADASERWPFEDDSIHAIFFSRAAHLVRPDHLVGEVRRVVRAGGCLILGRAERNPESMKSLMRRRMRSLLKEHGLSGRRGEATRRSVENELRGLGMEASSRTLVAARLQRKQTPRYSIDSWRDKDGLAGISVAAAVKDRVLEDLEKWALERFGRLDQLCREEESYVLEVFDV